MLVAPLIVKRRLKMPRENISVQVGKRIKPEGEGPNEVGSSHGPYPHIKYSSSHPIKQSLISKISKSLTNLRIAERYRGRTWHFARATLKVSFELLEKTDDLYTLPDNVKNIRLR